MIEETLINFLNYHMSAPAYTDKPKKDIPDEYYVFEKTGGSFEDHIHKSTIALQSYAQSRYRAAQLIEDANAAMIYELIKLDDISGVEMSGSGSFTDTTTKQHRYQSVFVITHY